MYRLLHGIVGPGLHGLVELDLASFGQGLERNGATAGARPLYPPYSFAGAERCMAAAWAGERTIDGCASFMKRSERL